MEVSLYYYLARPTFRNDPTKRHNLNVFRTNRTGQKHPQLFIGRVRYRAGWGLMARGGREEG